MVRHLIIFFCLSVFTGQYLLAEDPEYLQLIERSDSAIANRNYAHALDLIEQAMQLEPSNPSNILLLSNKGMLLYYIGEDSLAIETLNAAHNMAPVSVTVLVNRARVLNSTGNFSQALADYTLVTELDSTLIDPWRQKALLQLQGGDIRGAEASIERANEIEPDSIETLLINAILYSSTNRPGDAIPYFKKIVKKQPESYYFAAMAMCKVMTDDLGGASEDIGEGLALNENDPELYVARALLNKRRFREKDSKADAEIALKKGADLRRLQMLNLL